MAQSITMFAVKQVGPLLLDNGFPVEKEAYLYDGSGNPYRLHNDPLEMKLFKEVVHADKVVVKLENYIKKDPKIVKKGTPNFVVVPVVLIF